MNHYFFAKGFGAACSGVAVLLLVATTHSEETGLIPRSGIRYKAAEGDIKAQGNSPGGSFGAFGTEQKEIEPDDEQRSGDCPGAKKTQQLHLWDGTGQCLPGESERRFRPHVPATQKTPPSRSTNE